MEISLKDIKDLLVPYKSYDTPELLYSVGKNYLIRTVTHITIGRLLNLNENELLFEKAAWIADTGRYHDALKSGTLNEVEPYLDSVIVSRAAIVDATIWRHSVDFVQK